MDNSEKKKMPFLVWEGLLLLIVGAILLYQYQFVEKQSYKYEAIDTVFDNPMMGFVANADNITLAKTTNLVYVPVVWSEFEPEEGKYDFQYLREAYNLDAWQAAGKQVVIRFICDIPQEQEHMDIPEWLYEKTKDGDFYSCEYGKGYSPNYENETFIAYHNKAIKALGEEFPDESIVCYVELGSIGHWGEWHVNLDAGIRDIPSEEILKKYVDAYIEAFPNTQLLMRRPYSFVANNQMGVYNDMTGHKEETEEWLRWITTGGAYVGEDTTLNYTSVKDIWNTAAVGGEFTSSLTMNEMLGSKKDTTLSLLEDSHMTFIGPKIPELKEQSEYAEETDEVKAMLGYRYGITASQVRYDTLVKRLTVEFTMNNTGVAPMYYDWPVCIYVIDEHGNVVIKKETKISLSEISQGETYSTVERIDCSSYNWEEMPQVAVGIENPYTGKTVVKLNVDTKASGNKYYITK